MQRVFLISFLLFSIIGCSSKTYFKTVQKVDINRFMGDWYVIAGRFTPFEDGAHNAIESYKWNKEDNRVDISFTYNKDSFTGPREEITQKGWIEDKDSNAFWTVSPFWPLYFDYIVIDLDPDYQWTAVGVPSESYLWIMFRDWNISDEQLAEIVLRLEKLGYSTENIQRVPQNWELSKK